MNTLEDFENAPAGSVARIPKTENIMVKGHPYFPYPWADFTSTVYSNEEVFELGYVLDVPSFSNPSISMGPRNGESKTMDPVERLARLGVTALTTRDPDELSSSGFPYWSGNRGWAEHMLPIAQRIWDEGFDAGERDAFDLHEHPDHECIKNPYRKD